MQVDSLKNPKETMFETRNDPRKNWGYAQERSYAQLFNECSGEGSGEYM